MNTKSLNLKLILGAVYLIIISTGLYFLLSAVDIKDLMSYEFIKSNKDVILEYKVKNPHHKILITFFSPSGFEIVRHFGIADWVFYLPFDTRKNAKKFIESVQPIKMIFVKSEFWFNYIIELKKKNIPTFFISSSFRKNQYFFKFYGKWFSNKLKSITHFFVQNTESETLLNKIGIHKVSISGDS